MARNELHSDEFKTTVAKLWNDGNSAGVIADRTHSTRNAIIGVIHRLKHSGVTILPHVSGGSHPSKKRQKPSMPIMPPPHQED